MINWNNFDTLNSYKKMLSLKNAIKLSDVLDTGRIASYAMPMAGGLTYNYAAKQVNEQILSILQEVAEEQQLADKYKALLEGEIINTGEGRKVLHQLARGQHGADVIYSGRNMREFYVEQQGRVAEFAGKVHSGKITGTRGDTFTTVVQIGIGGSDLGPRALYLALEQWARKNGRKRMDARFISNVDPDDASAVVSGLDLPKTLFILVSKSGTTQETLANELFVKEFLKKSGLDPAKHMIAVTSETSPLANNPGYLTSFYMDDFIGGRFSSSSAVGGAVLSLAFGPDVFSEFLSGAAAADAAALEKDIRKNPALLDALIGVYERNALGYPSTAILPYSQALSRFPAHLQQADMESNGKQVNRRGEPVNYETGPVIFGEPGTNGQHSFFQLLHQGTDIIPLQFIGFEENQGGEDIVVDGSTSQKKLCANLAAQIVAFARGQSDSNPNKNFPGERPSSLIYGKQLTPETLGVLLSHYENKIMFQGFVWNINSFDQEGVQLGKILTKKVLSHEMDPVLQAYAGFFGL
ncbi:glucose-6-phosphate isomerase [Brucepastera parasyntrophica]|uniref:glucose-6-phosphate isomerase n=1 Tax=Brucepastera parasyntrophica TaxID=2880008 RepID=UPI0021095BB9|nr:glucose-6-phosphate isomerase [Brucepastera parasyntrophica]ULQ59570.1 glucose-6-phosphate isomerase [Brucepastera parasyntrophica]